MLARCCYRTQWMAVDECKERVRSKSNNLTDTTEQIALPSDDFVNFGAQIHASKQNGMEWEAVAAVVVVPFKNASETINCTIGRVPLVTATISTALPIGCGEQKGRQQVHTVMQCQDCVRASELVWYVPKALTRRCSVQYRYDDHDGDELAQWMRLLLLLLLPMVRGECALE